MLNFDYTEFNTAEIERKLYAPISEKNKNIVKSEMEASEPHFYSELQLIPAGDKKAVKASEFFESDFEKICKLLDLMQRR